MKNLFSAILLLFVFNAFSQEYVIDTSRTVKIGSIFYLDNFRIREDGTGQIPERSAIGDSLGYNRHQLAKYVNKSREWAYAAFEASQVNKLNGSLNNINRETVSNTGYSISDSIKFVYGDAFLGQWVYRNGSATNVTITRAGNGNLRASGLPGVAGNAFIVMRIISDKHFEFRNYPVDGTHQIFVSQDGVFFRNAALGVNVSFKKK
jgi:hypothetical protein